MSRYPADARPHADALARPATLALIGILVALGAWLRLDQWLDQVLIDDEWHALHQIIDHTPAQLFLSFGYADYSIPLGMLDAWIAAHFGLGEAAMRLPIMAAGLTTLVVIPWYLAPRVGATVAATHAFLLAISPLLVFYSRIARPYALTLLFGWIAHAACLHFFARHERGWGAAALYVGCAALATWAHPVAAPFVLAPLVFGVAAVVTAAPGARRRAASRFAGLSLFTGAAISALILPPLLSDYRSLIAKGGANMPTLDTLEGIWFAWYGTASPPKVVLVMLLAAIGAPMIWKTVPIARSGILGLALTALLVAATQPMWTHYAEVLARYLLPLVPLLLLFTAAGCATLANAARRRWPGIPGFAIATVAFAPCAALAFRSPLLPFLHHPNSYTSSIVAQFDYRPPHNIPADRLARAADSPFWQRFAAAPVESVRIAAAPFQFESFNWNGARWERISGQRVVPAWLTGFCRTRRFGEMPREPRFVPRNAVYIADASELPAKGIAWLVWIRPYTIPPDGSGEKIGGDVADCEATLRATFGVPDYEDGALIAFKVPPPGRDTTR
jgi:Dolichyl-phosphate-mannose-protein mannosyltransferase